MLASHKQGPDKCGRGILDRAEYSNQTAYQHISREKPDPADCEVWIDTRTFMPRRSSNGYIPLRHTRPQVAASLLGAALQGSQYATQLCRGHEGRSHPHPQIHHALGLSITNPTIPRNGSMSTVQHYESDDGRRRSRRCASWKKSKDVRRNSVLSGVGKIHPESHQ